MPILDSKAVKVLLEHDWPGNIRELRNIAERYVLLGESVQFELHEIMHSNVPVEGQGLVDQVSSYEKSIIEQALIEHKGNLAKVMEALQLPRRTLSDKLAKYDLERKSYLN